MRKALLLCVVLFSSVRLAEAQAVPCESAGTYRECRIATSGKIQLVMERSDRVCHEGVSWGTRAPGVVWVDRGCRGNFAVSEGGEPDPRYHSRVICESLQNKRHTCMAEVGKDVTLVRQLSKTACLQGETWDHDQVRSIIWVDNGCRAEFHLGKLPHDVPPAPVLESLLTCESENGKRKECPADTSAGAQIVRQFSDARCGFGREWGYDAKGIWVARGCRAEFAVRSKAKATAKALVCESMGEARQHCAAETTFGIALVRRLSEHECELGKSWGFDDEGVWVDAGCRAQFALGGYRLPPEAVPANAVKVRCESTDGKRVQCDGDAGRGVGLVRQLGSSACVLNRTWGYGPDGIWVDAGCRAEFVVAR